MKEYSCYLFDADGTLFDTAELIYQSFLYSCKKYGDRTIGRPEVYSSIGLTLRTQFERYLGPQDPDVMDTIVTDHMDYQLSIYTRYLKAFPGVVEALADLRSRNKKMGIVTSRKMQSLGLYLKETGMYDFFDVLVTPDETEKHKPNPEPVEKALELLGADPGESVYIGDAVFDIECGRNAGVDTVFVSWSLTGVDTLSVEATYVIDRMEQLYQ